MTTTIYSDGQRFEGPVAFTGDVEFGGDAVFASLTNKTVEQWTSTQFTEASWADDSDFTIAGPGGRHLVLGGFFIVDVPAASNSVETTGAELSGPGSGAVVMTGSVGAPAGPIDSPLAFGAIRDTTALPLTIQATGGESSRLHVTGRFRLVLFIVPVTGES